MGQQKETVTVGTYGIERWAISQTSCCTKTTKTYMYGMKSHKHLDELQCAPFVRDEHAMTVPKVSYLTTHQLRRYARIYVDS